MSAAANPITPARFAAALHDLGLASLHAKAAEIRNSIAHLRASNEQLQVFADAGDADCAEALRENEDVMRRMRERVELLREEVVRRGNLWVEGDDEDGVRQDENDIETEPEIPADRRVDGDGVDGVHAQAHAQAHAPNQSGDLTDAELARRMQERLGDDQDGGLHL